MNAIINAHLISQGINIEKGYIVYDENIIAYGAGELPSKYEDIETINANKNLIFPGMIDIHTHGALGFDFLNINFEEMKRIEEFFNKNGVTNFLATTVSASEKDLTNSLLGLRELKKKIPSLLGVHLEGPFINKEKAGAHQTKYLSTVNVEFINKFTDIIKIITYAPEIDEKLELNSLLDLEIVLSAGHTNANYEQGLRSLDYIKSATHIFNGMPSIHHRDPTITAALLLSDIYLEVIADTIHVYPALLEILYRLKGNKLILVTDSIAATGQADGSYLLGNQEITVNEGIATLKDSETLAGSTLLLIDAVKNFYNYTSASKEDVINYVTANPATLLKLHNKGHIKIGYEANLLITDEEFNIQNVIIGGKFKCV